MSSLQSVLQDSQDCYREKPCPEKQKKKKSHHLKLGTDGCEPLCGCLEMNLGPLQEQAFLTTQPSLVPGFLFSFAPRVGVATQGLWALNKSSAFELYSQTKSLILTNEWTGFLLPKFMWIESKASSLVIIPQLFLFFFLIK